MRSECSAGGLEGSLFDGKGPKMYPQRETSSNKYKPRQDKSNAFAYIPGNSWKQIASWVRGIARWELQLAMWLK